MLNEYRVDRELVGFFNVYFTRRDQTECALKQFTLVFELRVGTATTGWLVCPATVSVTMYIRMNRTSPRIEGTQITN